ncbi:MAG TPA: SAM-dependent methyltransferase [Spirochaetia bacterium]|nr:MAG: hypothetical protein A2Y41_04155 [Spirochaetes bacterium GWB1_36_13]HCL58159.1 SAM-dependent methyltransferase [Spirochaetia bacterium]
MKTGCLICEKPLVYQKETVLKKCGLCGKEEKTPVFCESGHFVCDACHTEDAEKWIRHYILNTELTDPAKMLVEILRHPSVNMHGPEHHHLLPLVILKSVQNMGIKIPSNALETSLERTKKLPGGTCGYWGACSAALAPGITASLFAEITPMNTQFYGMIHDINAKTLAKIARYGGPRCCKRNLFLSLEGALEGFEAVFGIKINQTPYVCSYFMKNQECLLNRCPFFKGGSHAHA